jgi:glycosyltransferase involved in cell wall biosynthesis
VKVLVLCNLYPPDVMGGYELGCRQVVGALRGRGHEVRVLTSAPRQPVPSEENVIRSLRLTDIWSHYIFTRTAPVTAHLAQAESHRVNAANVHALLAELETFEPDVVYVWMLAGVGGLGLMACLNHLRVPWVWHLMDDVPLLLCKSAGRLVPTFAREFGRRLEGTFLACSQQLVDEIERGGVSLGNDVEVIPNWVDGPSPQPRRAYLRDGILRIVSAAGLIERRVDKGIDLIIEAARALRAEGYDRFSVDLFGNVTDPYFPELIHEHNLSEFVRFPGFRSQAELGQVYSDYDVFAFPTRPREPFGFAPLEAAHAGCVPMMSHTCGIAEWLVHGVHCIKSPRTSEAFASHLAAILDGERDIAQIGRRVAAVVRRAFHLSAIIPRIEGALARAACRPRVGAGRADEAYRMALLAEKLSRVLIQETLCA